VPFFGAFGAAWDGAMVARWSANSLGILWPEWMRHWSRQVAETVACRLRRGGRWSSSLPGRVRPFRHGSLFAQSVERPSVLGHGGERSGRHRRPATAGGGTETFAAGDRLAIINEDPADATLADLSITFLGKRT
jgi:hypothetical protein